MFNIDQSLPGTPLNSWRIDGVKHLHIVIACIDLFLTGRMGTLSDEQRNMLTLARFESMRAARSWRYPAVYFRLRAGIDPVPNDAIDLHMLLSQQLALLPTRLREDHVAVQISAKLPPIRGDQTLRSLFEILLLAHYDRKQPIIQAEEQGPQHVVVRLQYPFLIDGLNEPEALTAEAPQLVFDVALMIIHHHGGNVTIIHHDGETSIHIVFERWMSAPGTPSEEPMP